MINKEGKINMSPEELMEDIESKIEERCEEILHEMDAVMDSIAVFNERYADLMKPSMSHVYYRDLFNELKGMVNVINDQIDRIDHNINTWDDKFKVSWLDKSEFLIDNAGYTELLFNRLRDLKNNNDHRDWLRHDRASIDTSINDYKEKAKKVEIGYEKFCTMSYGISNEAASSNSHKRKRDDQHEEGPSTKRRKTNTGKEIV